MIDYGLKNKVALITGANNLWGIGAATALAFAREGAKVVLVYKRVDAPLIPAKPIETALTATTAQTQEMLPPLKHGSRPLAQITSFWKVTFQTRMQSRKSTQALWRSTVAWMSS